MNVTRNFSDLTALITGATGGVGFEIAAGLVRGGANVVVAGRSPERGRRLLERLRPLAPRPESFSGTLLPLDLADFATIRAAAATLRSGPPIDFFVLNAGLIRLMQGRRQVTVDGFEVHLQVNFLGHYLLVQQLMPQLRQWQSGVVVQSSLAALSGRPRWADLQCQRRYWSGHAYAQSKLALSLWAANMAASGAQPRAAVVHPGVVPDTGVAPAVRRLAPAGLVTRLGSLLANSPEVGAEPALAALAAGVPNGSYFRPAGWGGIRGGAVAAPMPERFLQPSLTRGLLRHVDGLLVQSV